MKTIKRVKTDKEVWALWNELRANNYVRIANAYWVEIWENKTTGEVVQIERD